VADQDSSLPDDEIDTIREMLFHGQKIQAIKIYREATGLGLAESKEFIEALEAELRRRSPERFSPPEGRDSCSLIVAAIVTPIATWAIHWLLR